MTSATPAEARGRRLAWLLWLGVLVAVVGAVDALLLELGSAYFGSGYNGPALRGPLAITTFFASGVVIDGFLLLVLWALSLPLLRRLGLGSIQILMLLGVVGVAVPFTVDILRYRIHRLLGDMLPLELLWSLSGASVSGSLAEMAAEIPGPGVLLLAAGVGVAALVVVGRRLEGRFGADSAPRVPALRWIAAAAGAVAAAGAGVLMLMALEAPSIYWGLERKPSGQLLVWMVQRASDVDGDGFGLLSRPSDPAPFDRSRHPWALDLPGNGVDENGIGGDHPSGFRRTRPVAIGAARGEANPPVLMIFLETFRADLIGLRHGGREVTPFLNRLAREGTAARFAYAHTPSTAPSREQLLSGRYVYEPGDPTLLDDLRQRGYFIGHFSGQDDTHGNAFTRLGLDRCDVFYDARQDLERRTSRSTAPVSLQVSWKVLLERVHAFLETWPGERPLFLYVNVVDTHFPYHHREIDPLLGTRPLQRSDIRPENAELVWEAYLNTAANVDLAVERLVARWRERVAGDGGAILVTADHGQSFYEDGLLGHGTELSARQTRVPLILWGVGGAWPDPLGLADVRGLLLQNLFNGRDGGTPRAVFTPDPSRKVFQYVARIDQPLLLGLRGLDELAVLDVRRGRFQRRDGRDEALPRDAAADDADQLEIVRTWEAVRLERAAGAPTQEAPPAP